jgi:hypothetical protein
VFRDFVSGMHLSCVFCIVIETVVENEAADTCHWLKHCQKVDARLQTDGHHVCDESFPVSKRNNSIQSDSKETHR